MCPLAKSAEISSPIISSSAQPPDTVSRLEIGSVPIDLYTQLDIPLNADEKVVKKLKTIYDWASNELPEGSLGDKMIKIRNLGNRLGYPSGLEKKYDKLYNFCKMSLVMAEIDKKRSALTSPF